MLYRGEKEMIIYVVKPGDTLYEIARRYDVDLNRIVDDNQLDPNMKV